MNRVTILSSLTLLLFSISIRAQESKTFKETFNVSTDAVLALNTSHTDIEFETWNKNEVEIVATVTLENATKEEAEEYFKNNPLSISGNSNLIEVSTNNNTSWVHSFSGNDFDINFDFDFEPFFEAIEIPDLPEIAVLPEMPPLPPMPPVPVKSFDYQKYKEEGEKYIEEWSEEFAEGFDEEYQKKMEEWGKRMEERAKDWEERNAERLERMEERMEKRAEEMEKRQEEIAKRREEAMEKRMEAHEKRREAHEKRREHVISRSSDDGSSSFYFISSSGDNGKYQIKKTIKIKMPKSVKLKMNVKHGEVKLAANTKNLNASLRYASLLASAIDGDATEINAAYSPMVIENWNAGNLSTKYSDKIKLTSVKNLRLNATSSNIFIGKIIDDVYIVNNLGKTQIEAVDPNFTQVYVSTKNGELNCGLPQKEFNLKIVDKYSDVNYPKSLKVNVVKNDGSYIIEGCREVKKNTNPSFEINTAYSEVVLKD